MSKKRKNFIEKNTWQWPEKVTSRENDPKKHVYK